MPAAPDSQTIHASCVAVDGRAVIIIGASGAGKSTLALHLMALGAALVADDQTVLTKQGGEIVASSPPRLAGLIEARGVGVLRAASVTGVPVALIVDLDQTEPARLPPKHHRKVMGVPIDLVFAVPYGHFPFAILQYLRSGRQDDGTE
ncbi:HPr kinase/phosphorylase [Pseudorhodobacter sp.]|uniref:HPr kinase/phosphorylase n=1 Tax=Pseudorhodobacter sp. TaxID=1934400 RepID=UPI002647E166|nr:HPr kinase/phosphatase C-terminal domain-containing protein [Pseudorhodobacter sp.]MDN5785950.1 HPr kinase/phosphatase C-terminal domain-containing protein [Pseudorhodobacter sp.]